MFNIKNAIRVRGSVKPPEWDFVSSAVTVYHRTNIAEVQTDDGRIEWEYDELQMTFDEFYETMYHKKFSKLNDLDGMCSGAIYQGVNIGSLHYNFSEKTQINLSTIAILIGEGQTTFLYRADNEQEQRVYTADEMKTIITVKSEWIAVNTNYYESLKKWIARETDKAILNNIHYGSMLPSDLMQELAAKLNSIGIDVSKYTNMFK